MSPPAVPAPPSSFPSINVHGIAAGTVLHRTHLSRFRAAQFNPCQGQATRFASFQDAAGACVPTLYAATTREAAAFESIFHDIEPDAPFKTVKLSDVLARSVSRISPMRDVKLASLFTPDLAAWGLNRNELIDTPKSTYHRTVLWAQALHRTDAGIDGLVWTSRRCDPEQCVILFEDRIGESEFQVHDRIDIRTDPHLLGELRSFGRRSGITIVC